MNFPRAPRIIECESLDQRLYFGRDGWSPRAGPRNALVRNGLRDHVIARSFALTREVAARTIGERHFDVQLLGGYALLKGTTTFEQLPHSVT